MEGVVVENKASVLIAMKQQHKASVFTAVKHGHKASVLIPAQPQH